MNNCSNCVWSQIKDAKVYCDRIKANNEKCDRFLPLTFAVKVNDDGTFECPRCKRNRDPGSCWCCGLKD